MSFQRLLIESAVPTLGSLLHSLKATAEKAPLPFRCNLIRGIVSSPCFEELRDFTELQGVSNSVFI